MYVEVVPNHGSRPSVLLREGWREGGKVRKRTIANLSRWPSGRVLALRALLRGDSDNGLATFECVRSRHHGHVKAVRVAMTRLGFDGLISSRPCRERDLVLAMVAAQLLHPKSKLATTRCWHTTTLAETFGVAACDENDLYAALDWLLSRQEYIEKKLAARHLKDGGLVLYDLSSSYFEGKTCPLAALGHNRDGKKGKLQVNYGLLTDARGCPVAVTVFKGNTADPKTLLPQIEKVTQTFGIAKIVIVGDRGMISQVQINALKKQGNVDWVTALRSSAISKLVATGHVQLGLFDERNLFEIEHPDFPGERLIACRNKELAKLRVHKRQALLDATTKELERVKAMVLRGSLCGKDKIGVRVGKVVNKYMVAKHVVLEIGEATFDFHIEERAVAAEAALDGIYVIRTSVSKDKLSADDTVRTYKRLSDVERAFRSMKTIDLEVRPIRHRLESRVRAHILLCMLARYVNWHMSEAWRPMLFADEEQQAKWTRDPVAPAKRSAGATRKAFEKTTTTGELAHSFATLLTDLSSIVRSTCQRPGDANTAFDFVTTPSVLQQRAFDLLATIRP